MKNISAVADISNQLGKGVVKDIDEAMSNLENRISEQ